MWFDDVFNIFVFDESDVRDEFDENEIDDYLKKFTELNVKVEWWIYLLNNKSLDFILKTLIKDLGYQNEINETIFYPSLKYVVETDDFKLLLHQLMNYITRYYFNMVYGVYVPEKEKFEQYIYKNQDNINYKGITVVSKKHYIELIKKEYIYSNRVLSENVVNHLMGIIKEYDIDVNPDKVKNRDLLSSLFLFIDMKVPPNILLQSVVLLCYQKMNISYNSIINNKETREAMKRYIKYVIRNNNLKSRIIGNLLSYKVQDFFEYYKPKRRLWNILFYAIGGLTGKNEKLDNFIRTVFNYKGQTFDSRWKSLIEEKKYNEALDIFVERKQYFIQKFTELMKKVPFDIMVTYLRKYIDGVSLQYKVQLLNTLRFRKVTNRRRYTEVDLVLFQLRHRKRYFREGYANKYYFILESQLKKIEEIIWNSIKRENRTIWIEPRIHNYKLPLNTKNMIAPRTPILYSTLPIKSEGFILGIHWKNKDTDWDLGSEIIKVINGKLAGRSTIRYYTKFKEGQEIVHSGDMTHATEKGATEILVINGNNLYLIDVTKFKGRPVDNFQLYFNNVSREHIDNILSNNNALLMEHKNVISIPVETNKKSIQVGIVDKINNRFIFGKPIGQRSATTIYNDDQVSVIFSNYLIHADNDVSIFEYFSHKYSISKDSENKITFENYNNTMVLSLL